MITPNRLYFGDCLDVMREDIPDESVDLIYLFNSKRLYNAFMGGVLRAEIRDAKVDLIKWMVGSQVALVVALAAIMRFLG